MFWYSLWVTDGQRTTMFFILKSTACTSIPLQEGGDDFKGTRKNMVNEERHCFSWFILFCCSTVCWICGWLPSWSGPLCKRDLWHYLNFLGQVWRKHGHLDQQRFKQELMYNLKSWVPTPLSVMKQPQGLAWTGLTSKRVLVVKQWALHIQQMTPGAYVAKTEISEAGSWLGSYDQTASVRFKRNQVCFNFMQIQLYPDTSSPPNWCAELNPKVGNE